MGDELMSALNDFRRIDLNGNMHVQLFLLETFLKNLREGQGLGFAIMGVVVHTGKVWTIMVWVFGLLSTIIPLEQPLRGSAAPCGLTESDRALLTAFVKATF